MTELPEGWEIRRLEDLCEPGKQAIVDGPFGSNLKRSDYVDSGIPVLKIQNIKENLITLKKMDYVSPDKYQELVRHSFTEGDIVMTKLGDPLGVSAIVNGIPNGLIVADLVRIRPSRVLTKFLCYQLNSPRIQKYINEQQKGTTRPRVNLAMIRELPIYKPPIEEQHKIVELLEDHLSRLDAALADVKQAKVKAAQFRRSLLQAAFTGNLGSDGTRLMTDLPNGWNLKSLSSLVTLLSGFAYKSSDWKESGVPVLKITNVRNGRVRLEGCSYISKERATESKQFAVHNNDLLITMTGEIGATGFYREEFEARLNQRVGKLVVKEGEPLNLKYLAYFFESPETRQVMWKLAKGIAQANISPKEILNLEIPLPPLPEQHKIVEILEDHLSRLDASIALADAIEKQSAGLRRSLLQASFNGQLTKEVASV